MANIKYIKVGNQTHTIRDPDASKIYVSSTAPQEGSTGDLWLKIDGDEGNVVFDGVVENNEVDDVVYLTPLIQVESDAHINVDITNMEWDYDETPPTFEPEPQPIILNNGRALIGKITVSGKDPIVFSIMLRSNKSYIQIDGMSDTGTIYFKFHLHIEKVD